MRRPRLRTTTPTTRCAAYCTPTSHLLLYSITSTIPPPRPFSLPLVASRQMAHDGQHLAPPHFFHSLSSYHTRPTWRSRSRGTRCACSPAPKSTSSVLATRLAHGSQTILQRRAGSTGAYKVEDSLHSTPLSRMWDARGVWEAAVSAVYVPKVSSVPRRGERERRESTRRAATPA